MGRIPNLPFCGPWRPFYSSHPGSSAASPCPLRPLLQLRGAWPELWEQVLLGTVQTRSPVRARRVGRGGMSRCSSGSRGGWCANSEYSPGAGSKDGLASRFKKTKKDRKKHMKQRSSVPAWVKRKKKKKTQTIKKQELKSNKKIKKKKNA